MVRIGGSGSKNSRPDITRQILNGITSEDLAQHGGTLAFDADGVLELDGVTGVYAGMKDELTAIRGQPRAIPVYDQVTGQGTNARFRIVPFVAARRPRGLESAVR